MTKTAVIMAGGRGRRLLPYTWVLPKPLMPVGDMPVLELLLRQLAYYEFTEIVLAVGYRAEYIQAFVTDGKKYGLTVRYSLETQPLGTAGPLGLISGLDEPFLIMNGDLLTSLNFRAVMESHLKRQATATVGITLQRIQVSLGVIDQDDQQRITGWREKPTHDYWVSMGISALNPSVLSLIPPGQPFDMPDLIRTLIQQEQPVFTYPFENGYWLDIGRPDDYEKALREIDDIMPILLPNWKPVTP
jgi:NDP-sugar pyrophosphorylase family protein